MSTNKDAASLVDISQAAYKILEYKQGLSKSEFMNDDKTQSSVLYQLLIYDRLGIFKYWRKKITLLNTITLLTHPK